MKGFGAGQRMEECVHFKGLLKMVTGKSKVNNCKVEKDQVTDVLANWLLLLQSQRPSG